VSAISGKWHIIGKWHIVPTLAVIFAILLAGPGAALTTRYDSASEETILALTDMAVLGTVTASSARWSSPERAMIVTDYAIEVEHVAYDPDGLLGGTASGETITLVFAGGTVGDEGAWIPGIPAFEVGDTAVFLLRRENLNAFSPLVAAHRGLYRVREEAGARRVYDSAGRPWTRAFFSDDRGGGEATPLERFLDDLATALPRARADLSLIPGDPVSPPAAPGEQEFRGSGVPLLAYSGGRAPEAASKLPARAPEPQGGPAPSTSPGGVEPEFAPGEIGVNAHGRYAFQNEPPDPPWTFNVPPMYYGVPNFGLAFENMMAEWNHYAPGVFQKHVPSYNTWGSNSRNDFAMLTATQVNTVYGYLPSASWLGFTAVYTNILNEILEADVIARLDIPWALDFTTAYNTAGTFYFYSTVIHELGHSFGRQHQFTADPNARVHSVLNYVAGPELDAEFRSPYMDDAGSMRVAFPSNAVGISDYGVYLYETNGQGGPYPNGVPVEWASFPAMIQQGQMLFVQDVVLENLGTTTVEPVVEWYLTTLQHSWAGTNYLVHTTYHSTIIVQQYTHTPVGFTVPLTVPPGSYYIAAWGQSDSNNWNRYSWSKNQVLVVEATSPVEGAFYAVETAAGPIVLRWTVESLAGIEGFRVYRAADRDGPFEMVNDGLIRAATPGEYRDDTVWPESTFWYELRAVDAGGVEEAVGDGAVSVTTGGRLATRLAHARPNPFSQGATIEFDVPDYVGRVTLTIHDVAGRVVRRLADGHVGRGRHVLSWDGRDERGREVASAMYFVRLDVDGDVVTRKLMKIR